MKALVYHGNHNISLDDVPMPTIRDDRDAILKVELSTICGSDIHIKEGIVPVKEGTILGHEFVGEVVETGTGVRNIRVGDRVAANCITSCGNCFYCKRGFINHCEDGGWQFGYTIDGGQAEYVRIPHADSGLYKIPDGVSYKDVLYTGDILSTGYFGAERGEIQPGDIVVVIGSGPVGMCAMMSARLFGPALIVAVDTIDERLAVAKANGCADITLNSIRDDVIGTILGLTDGRGADVSLEAAGVKATFDLAWQVVRPNGHVSIIALYGATQELPMQDMGGKNLTIRSGWVDSVHMPELIRLIAGGRIKTDFLATHEAPLNDILNGYDIFGGKKDNCIKWLVTPYAG